MMNTRLICLMLVFAASGCSVRNDHSTRNSIQIVPSTNHELVDAQSADGYEQIAARYEQMQLSDMAIAAYEKALALEPYRVACLEKLSVLYVKKQQLDKALPVFETLATVEPSAKNYNNLGMVNMQQKNYEIAEESFRQSLAMDADYQKAKNNLTLLEISKLAVAHQQKPPVNVANSASNQHSEATLQSQNPYLYSLDYEHPQPVNQAAQVIQAESHTDTHQHEGSLDGLMRIMSMLLLALL